MKLIDSKGQRLFLTSKERENFLEAAKNATRVICTFLFCHSLFRVQNQPLWDWSRTTAWRHKMVMIKEKNIGFTLESFLKEEGNYEETLIQKDEK